MTSCAPSLRSHLALLGFAFVATTAAAGQSPDSAQHVPAMVLGTVVDTTGAGISDAEIVVLAGDTPVVRPAISDSQGNFRIRRLPPGGPYTFIARKMGYKPSRGRDFQVKNGDTLRLRFVLEPVVVVLAPITVKGRRRDRSRIFADEFASKVKIYRNALDLMTWYRPYMLGDPEFCSPPDSFGRPINDRLRLRVTRNLIFNSMGKEERLDSFTSKPWLDSLKFSGAMTEPNLPYVRQIFVNGLRADRPGDPIRTPLRILRAIPTQHIAEMHYVDCWDQSMPVGMQYSIVVILKPLTPVQRDSMFDFILAQAASIGPIEGNVMSIKRPTREVWDSLVQVLTGRDTAAAD